MQQVNPMYALLHFVEGQNLLTDCQSTITSTELIWMKEEGTVVAKCLSVLHEIQCINFCKSYPLFTITISKNLWKAELPSTLALPQNNSIFPASNYHSNSSTSITVSISFVC